MSARVLNPAMMSEMGHRGIVGGGGAGPRVAPSRAALARVRRDLFGPVDHAAARALAERELRAQSLLDAERWGFDFHLEIPRTNSRYEWSPIKSHEVVPEPYALRGMPYLRKHAPATPTKTETTVQSSGPKLTTRKRTIVAAAPVSPITMAAVVARKAERTPPQEARVPDNGDLTTGLSDDELEVACSRKKRCAPPREQTTPVLPPAARKQPSITGTERTFRGIGGATILAASRYWVYSAIVVPSYATLHKRY